MKLTSLFDYQKRPIEIYPEKSETRNNVTVQTVSIVGMQRLTSAYLVNPLKAPSTSTVLYIHPGLGNKSNFLSEAEVLAKMGATSLLLEAPWADPDFGSRLTNMSPTQIRDLYVELTIDFRRATDLLENLLGKPVIGFVGSSIGALFGGILAGIEKRVKTYVLIAGIGSFTDLALANIPNLKGKLLEDFQSAFAPIDPVNYVKNATPAELFFQFGTEDYFFTKQKFIDFYTAASSPKTIRWYDTDHYGLNEAGCADRVAWLNSRLT